MPDKQPDSVRKEFINYLDLLGISPKSHKNYRSDLTHFLAWAILKIKSFGSYVESLTDIVPFLSANLLAEYRSYMTENSAPAKTINRRLSTLRHLSKFLVESQVVDSDFMIGVDNIRTSLNKVIKTVPVVDNFKSFLEAEKVSANTIKSYISDAKHFNSWLESKSVPLSGFSPDLANEYKAGLTPEFSEATQKRKLISIHKLLDWAEAKGIIEKAKYEPEKNFITAKPAVNKWIKKYRSIPGSSYLGFAVAFVLFSLLGFGIYSQFINKANISLASAIPPTRPNRYLSFQGRLTNQFGNPVVAPTDVVFKLYDAATDGTELWNSGTCSVSPDTDGVFSTLLGSGCGIELTTDIFSQNAGVWLGLTVGTDAEATPRIQIATVAYSLNSETLQGYPASAAATINTIPVINNAGVMVLAASSPKIQSTSGTFAIEGKAVTISTPTASNGNITIAPDGTGSANFTFSGASAGNGNGMMNVTDANLTSTSLYYGSVASNASGYNLLQLQSGSSPTDKFVVDYAGNTTIAGNLNVNGNTTLGNATADSLTFTGRVAENSSLIPIGTTGTNDLGSASLPWDNIYATNITAVAFTQNGYGVCDSNGTNCPASGVNYWGQPGGALYPLNNTVDLLLGSSATSSAKFAFTGVNSGTPTASISGATNIATFIDGNGNISSTNRNNLVLGNSATYNSTGNILLNPNGTGNVGIGTLSPNVTLDVAGAASISGSLTFRTGASSIQTTAFNPLTFGGDTTGNITLNPSNAVAGGFVAPGTTNVTDLGTASKLFRNIYGTALYQGVNQVCDAGGAVVGCTSAGVNYWGQVAGAIYPLNKSVDLLLGSSATSSAKFAFTGVNSGTPTASIAGTVAGVATFTDGNGNISTTNRNDLTLGNSATYNSTGNILLNPNGTGNVGIGTTSPTGKLDIQGLAVNDSPTLGAELLTGGSWTSTNWTGNNTTGWTHTTGNSSPLSYSATVTVGNLYQITVVKTGDETGFASMTVGGAEVGIIDSFNGTFTHAPKALTTVGLIVTPDSTFDGTIIISVKQITAISNPLVNLKSSDGTARIEIRSNNVTGNQFIGVDAGGYNTTGGYNTANGNGALSLNTTGYHNTANGNGALNSNTTGYQNTANGSSALYLNTTGFQNTANGANTLYKNTTGYQNTAQGYFSLYSNIDGDFNTAQGGFALYSNIDGNSNIGIGYEAGRSLTTGDSNTFLGNGAGYNGSQLTNVTNSMALGNGAYTTASNQIVIGNTAITQTLLMGNVGIGTTSPLSRLSVVSTSANSTGKAAFLVDQYENQDIFTASASGATKLVLTNAGTLKLLGATSSISNTAGDITINAASNFISFSGDNIGNIASVSATVGAFTGAIQVATNSAVPYSRFGAAVTTHALASAQDVLMNGNLELNGVLYLNGRNIAAPSGTATIILPLDPTAQGSTNVLTNGSWLINNPSSGNNGMAALMVNQGSASDIFTASASGVPKFTISNAGNVGIGSTTFDAVSPEKLLVNAGTTTSYNVISGRGSINNYLQLNIQNQSTGTGASSDVVATADNGSETTNFIDMGINGSGYTGGVFGAANDAYLYNIGQNMLIGTGTSGKTLSFLTGGTSAASNTRMTIGSTGNVGIGTTAPYARLESQTADIGSGIAAGANNMVVNIAALTTNTATLGMGGAIGIGGYNNGTSAQSLFGIIRAYKTNSTAGDSSGTLQLQSYRHGAGWNTGLVMDNLGNVGIGTTAPLTKLQIAGGSTPPLGELGSLMVTGSTSSMRLALGVDNSSTMYSWLQSVENGSMPRNLALNPNAGNVGIGTTSPGATLDVKGGTTGINIQGVTSGASAYGLAFASSGVVETGAGTAYGIYMPSDMSSGSTNAYSMYVASGGWNYFAGAVGIGTAAPGATLHVVGSVCVQNATACPAPAAGTIRYDTASTSFDIAEEYPTSEPVFPGEIVTTGSGKETVAKSQQPYDTRIIGIISTNPNIAFKGDYSSLGGGATAMAGTALVALSGRVPLIVSLENGPIHIGDPLTSSSVPGVAMKATRAGQIVGKALEDYTQATDTNKIITFVNVAWYDPEVYLTSTGDLHIQLNANADSNTNNYQLTQNGSIIDRIAAFGTMVAANINAGVAVVDSLLAQSIQTALISPIPGGTDVTVQIGSATESGKFAIQNSEGAEVASIDSAGNASFSGIVRSQNIDEIQALLNQVQTDQSILLAATASANINATGSANIAELITNDLFVTGQAAMNSLSLSQSLTIGSDMVVSSQFTDDGTPFTSINTLSAPLQIQSLAMAPVEIMGGLISFDTKGNMQIAGNLNVKGRIESSGLTLKDSEQSTVNGELFASPSALLSLQNSAGNEVAGVDASGSASFRDIITGGLTIASSGSATQSAVINGAITTNATAGSAIISADVSEITIKNPKVTDYTLVYVTPTSSTQNNVLYVKSKQAGQFVVGFTNAINTDVNFNWWIVQVAP